MPFSTLSPFCSFCPCLPTPHQRHQWSDGSDPSTASRETVLFHDRQRQFAVVLFRRDFVKIFSENSAFEITGKSEPHPRNRRGRRRGGGGGHSGGGGKSGGGEGDGRLFHFLSVQFKSVNPADVEVLIGKLVSHSCAIATLGFFGRITLFLLSKDKV